MVTGPESRDPLTQRGLGCTPRHHGPTSPYAKDHHLSAIAPVASSSFAPQERQQPAAGDTQAGRTGRHEPIRSSTTRIASRGAGLGVTLATGVAAGINYLEHDLQLALLAGGQVGTVAAGMAFVGAWTERRRMTRVAVLRALL